MSWKKQDDIPGHSAPNLWRYIWIFPWRAWQRFCGWRKRENWQVLDPWESPLTWVFWRVLSWDAGRLMEGLHPPAQWPWSPATTCHIWHHKLYPVAVRMQLPSRKWKKKEVCNFNKHIGKCLEWCISVQIDELWGLPAKAVTWESKTSNYN